MRFITPMLLLLVPAIAFGQMPENAPERQAKINAAISPADVAVMQEAQQSYKTSIAEYLDGAPTRAIPLLLRYASLEAQQQNALASMLERAGLPKLTLEAEAANLQTLALAHGRLARAYALHGDRESCRTYLDRATGFGQKAAEAFQRSEFVDLVEAAKRWGMDSPERVFASVKRFDESERSGKPYQSVKANCLLEGDAQQNSLRAPQQGR